MKRQVDVLDYTESILKGVKSGVLLTTAADGKVNTMAISWGTLGIEWGRVIFTTFVRLGRFTREMLDKNSEFTVNIPLDGSDKSIVGKCGTCSGRAVDKIRQFNLTLVDGEKVSVPAIREFPLTLECRVIFKQIQDKAAMRFPEVSQCYPEDIGSEAFGANRDTHIAYVGEVVNAYVIE